ncbi:hypothetical protein D3C87_1719520 [compost metagenome]
MLFMMDDSSAAMNPAPKVAAQMPCSANRLSISARYWVSPALRKPYTTRYIPNEKITICHGASRITLRVLILWPRPATSSSIAAPTAATTLTGTPSGSSPKKPTSSSASTAHPDRNVFRSRMAAAGGLSWLSSYRCGMLFLKYRNKTTSDASTATTFTGAITAA